VIAKRRWDRFVNVVLQIPQQRGRLRDPERDVLRPQRGELRAAQPRQQLELVGVHVGRGPVQLRECVRLGVSHGYHQTQTVDEAQSAADQHHQTAERGEFVRVSAEARVAESVGFRWVRLATSTTERRYHPVPSTATTPAPSPGGTAAGNRATPPTTPPIPAL
jgi:hypothetical protein